MTRIVTTPWAKDALGSEFIEAVRIRIPLGYQLDLSGRTTHGPWRVMLRKGFDVLFDEEHADLEGTIEAALACLPTELEAQLAASLAAIR